MRAQFHKHTRLAVLYAPESKRNMFLPTLNLGKPVRTLEDDGGIKDSFVHDAFQKLDFPALLHSARTASGGQNGVVHACPKCATVALRGGSSDLPSTRIFA